MNIRTLMLINNEKIVCPLYYRSEFDGIMNEIYDERYESFLRGQERINAINKTEFRGFDYQPCLHFFIGREIDWSLK
jgi:hypothetical protein